MVPRSFHRVAWRNWSTMRHTARGSMDMLITALWPITLALSMGNSSSVRQGTR
jgi:hypothetical protein